MKSILAFITQNYLWFVAVAVILLLALIGYFVDVRKEADDSPFKKSKIKEDLKADNNIENIQVENNVSLSEMLSNTNTNPNPTDNNK